MEDQKESEIGWPEHRRRLVEEIEFERRRRNRKRTELEDANADVDKAILLLSEWDQVHPRNENVRCRTTHAGSSTCPGCH